MIRYILSTFLAIAVVCGANAPVGADATVSNRESDVKGPAMISQSVTVEGITLTVACPKVMVSGEPDMVTVTIRNDGAGPVEYYSRDSMGPLAFEVSRQGKPMPKLLLEQGRTSPENMKSPSPYNLEKGKQIELKVNLGRRYDLSVPGDYEVIALWTGKPAGAKEAATLKTPAVKCEVIEKNIASGGL